MLFSDFANRLHAIIGAGSGTVVFTKSIVEAILSDEAPAITDEYKEDAYKAFFNGNTKITRLAKKMMAYIEPYNFSNYIDGFSDAAHDLLVNSFSDVLPNATPHDVGEQLAGLFESILKEAAMLKRKTPKKATTGSDAHERLKEKILASGAVLAEKCTSAVEQIVLESDNKKTGSPEDEPETVTAEVEDDKQPSGAVDTDEEPIQAEVVSDPDVKIQIINNPTIVNQNGEKNIHIEHLDVLNL